MTEFILAEGDSWFEYSILGRDIIDCLKSEMGEGVKIINLASPGDKLEDMIYGNRIKGVFGYLSFHEKQQFEKLQSMVKKNNPKVILFSGGGNDFAGRDLYSLLKHRESADKKDREISVVEDLLFKEHTESFIQDYLKNMYIKLIKTVEGLDEKIQIISHGYGYPNINDPVEICGIKILYFNRKYFLQKGIINTAHQNEIIRYLIDLFNDMLKDLSLEYNNFQYIDLRDIVKDYELWENDLHLNPEGFKKAAREFKERIMPIILSA